MLLFYGTYLSRLPHLRDHGIRDALLWRRLGRAKKAGGEIYLVVNTHGVSDLIDDGGHFVVAPRVPPAALKNLSPYIRPRQVCAAGGVVFRAHTDNKEVLVIRRHAVWDLPKGKCNRKEGRSDCAYREVCEETGIEALAVGGKVGKTVHGYTRDGRYHVKRTHWYQMVSNATRFSPQEDEGITEVRWMPSQEAIEKLEYEVLQRLLRSVTVPSER